MAQCGRVSTPRLRWTYSRPLKKGLFAYLTSSMHAKNKDKTLRNVFYNFEENLGVDFKNNQTTKQVNNSIWTNRKQVKFCLPSYWSK